MGATCGGHGQNSVVSVANHQLIEKEASVMKVFVIGRNGLGLMPTKPRLARILLSKGKAIVVKKRPFTIKLLYKTGSATQHCEVGIDTGSQHIGVAIVADDVVLTKEEWELRSSMEKRSLMETRKEYRSGRRYRKTRYRHPKFMPHTKRVYYEKAVTRHGHKTHWIKVKNEFTSYREDGWLAPSLQSKVDHHHRIIDSYLSALPKDTHLNIELARFDTHKAVDPDVTGEGYQYGPLYQQENLKAYVFARDNYTCQICGAKAGRVRKDGSTVKLIGHHINYRSNGTTNNPSGILSVCDKCHTQADHQPGGKLYQLMISNKKIARGLRDMTTVNIVVSQLRKMYPSAFFTYGNYTKANRDLMGLLKSHANDAVAIAKCQDILFTGNLTICDCNGTVYYKQVRRKKRSLHEANPRKGRKTLNRTAKRYSKNTKRVKGYDLYAKVTYDGQLGYISGFTGTSAYIQDWEGSYIRMQNKTYLNISLSKLHKLDNGHNWLSRFIPSL